MLSEVDIGAQVPAITQPLKRLFLPHSAIVAVRCRKYEHGTLNMTLCVLPVFKIVMMCCSAYMDSSHRKSCDGTPSRSTLILRQWKDGSTIRSTLLYHLHKNNIGRSLQFVGMTKQNIPLLRLGSEQQVPTYLYVVL